MAATRTSPSTRRRGETTRAVRSSPARRRLRSAAPLHVVAAAQRQRERRRRCAPAAPARRSTHAVSLPSIVRCTRSQVVNGRRFSAAQRHVGQIDRDDAEPAGLQHEVERLERAIERPVEHGDWPWPIGSNGLAADPQQRDRDRRRRQQAEATSRRSKVSTSAAISPRRVAAAIICSRSVMRPDERGPAISDSWPRGSPPRRQASSAATSRGDERRRRQSARATAARWSACDRACGRGARLRERPAHDSPYFRLSVGEYIAKISETIKRRNFA